MPTSQVLKQGLCSTECVQLTSITWLCGHHCVCKPVAQSAAHTQYAENLLQSPDGSEYPEDTSLMTTGLCGAIG